MSKLWQEIDKLRIFVMVADKGKINEAAELLGFTQPSITRSIQKLEGAFGSPLFIRSREGVKLTRAGHMLYGMASRLLLELEDLQIRAQHSDQEISGKVTLGTYESLAEYLWPDFLMLLQEKHPQLHLSVRTSFSQNPVAELASGQLDILVDAEPQLQSSMISWPLYSDKFSFFSSLDFGISELTSADAKLTNIIFVQKAFDEDRLTIENHLERAGYQFARKYCFDSFSTAKRLAIKGMGIAVLPQHLAREDVKKKLIKPIILKGISVAGFGKHSIYATTAYENRNDVRIKKIVALLKNQFR